MGIWLIVLAVIGAGLLYRYATISPPGENENSHSKLNVRINIKIILLIIVSIGIMSWIIFEEITATGNSSIFHSNFFGQIHWQVPTLGDSGEWVWRNWLMVILFYGIIMGILSLLKREEKWEKETQTLKKIATGVVLFAFFGIPVMNLAVGVVHPEKTVRETTFCSDISNHEVRECKINSRWSNWIKPEPGTPDGLQECFNGIVDAQNGNINGYSVFRFRSKNGITSVSYKAKASCGKGPL